MATSSRFFKPHRLRKVEEKRDIRTLSPHQVYKLIEQDPVFQEAASELGLDFGAIWKMTKQTSWDRAQRACVFVLSLCEDFPNYFSTGPGANGDYTNDPVEMTARARRMTFAMGMSWKYIFVKCWMGTRYRSLYGEAKR